MRSVHISECFLQLSDPLQTIENHLLLLLKSVVCLLLENRHLQEAVARLPVEVLDGLGDGLRSEEIRLNPDLAVGFANHIGHLLDHCLLVFEHGFLLLQLPTQDILELGQLLPDSILVLEHDSEDGQTGLVGLLPLLFVLQALLDECTDLELG